MTDTVIILPGEGSGAEPGLMKSGSAGTVLTPGGDLISLPLTNYMAATESPDTFAAIGYAGYPGVVGDLAVTEVQDTFAAVGYTSVLMVLAAGERSDIFSAYGMQPLTGHLTVTEHPDIFAAVGTGYGVNGVFITVENPDIFAAVGNSPISGVLAVTEVPDRFTAIGVGVTQVRRRRTFFVT